MNYPCTADEACARALAATEQGGHYMLGTGDYHPGRIGIDDVPFTGADGKGCDCAGFAICYAWKIVRHRPGFNKGPWSTCEDDVNVNSAIEDGEHAHELFDTMPAGTMPQPGDLLCYPTFYLNVDGERREFVGHVGFVHRVPADYRTGEGWRRLEIIQCHGPNGRAPAVVITDGSIWDHHDALWAKPAYCTRLVRPKAR